MIYAIVIGRKGSEGFPGKNVYPVIGHPLAYYPMKAATMSQSVDKVYLSTDDEKLMDLGRKINIEIIERPLELCTKEALGEDVFVHGYYETKKRNENKEIEMMILLFCNAPMVTSQMIEKGITILRERQDIDSCVSVSRYNMWSPLRARKIGDDGLLHPFIPFETFGNPATLNCDRDSQGDVWFADMSVSVVRPQCLENIKDGLLPQKWMGQKIYPLKQTCGLDVDYEWQLPQVEYCLLKMQKNP
ncbi:N-acylneuraminate cytidylyltransferase [Candidatus Magnetobacterium bavaricum]|uniref:N-acylneuraminate cytidylyltransferase n=1 Tax=Candidatus Magnetobacterium bavaricum TaxID=29290 RepID=A0A0F3GJT0_9BACT|nr:N-acylneuraminate cytidylyltransferase [Candidatus Magnetobacterium bavaricum]